MNRGDLLGAALVGGGLALLGAAIGGAFREERSTPPPAPTCDAMSLMMRLDPGPSRTRSAYAYMPPERNDRREERARQVRVLVYRVQIGELTLASPEIPADLSADIADALEGNGIPPPSAAAEGALPLDWQ